MEHAATLFFDVGGVLLTNGWDEAARTRAAEHFHLDSEDFQKRHRALQRPLETAAINFEQYLQQTVFYQPRPFTPAELWNFIREESRELPGSLDFLRSLAAAKCYRLFTLNNESAELNEYRIERFGLDAIFDSFLSSCYLKAVKPEPEIYRAALAITRCGHGRAIFVDDRAANVQAARQAGLDAIQFQTLDQLRADLAARGVVPDAVA
jgi:putative hydrolase of the HAD superfamily